ncbi:MAG: polysaccharide biosynthesis/export family protein [Thermogutta sp.]
MRLLMVRWAMICHTRCPLIYNAWIAVAVLTFWNQWLVADEPGLIRLPPVGSQDTQNPFQVSQNLVCQSPFNCAAVTWLARREGSQAPSALPLEVIQPDVRSLRLEQAAKQADLLALEGYDLAGRGAFFAARAKFRDALVVLAQALDAEARTYQHSQMLDAAWVALKEAEDFLPQHGSRAFPGNLAQIIARHDSPALKDLPLDFLTPLEAYQIYLGFAQDLLSRAMASEITGSMALRGLGKIYAESGRSADLLRGNSEAQAMVFYQAALNVWPGNYMAANDLAVLLARGGRWDDAVCVLEYASRIQPDPVILANLAKVNRQRELTRQTPPLVASSSEVAEKNRGYSTLQIAWVPPEVLAEGGIPTGSLAVPIDSAPAEIDTAGGPTGANRSAFSERRLPILPFLKGKTSGTHQSGLLTQMAQHQAFVASNESLQVSPQRVHQGDVVSPAMMREASVGVSLPNPASPCPRCAVDGSVCDPSKWGGWTRARMIAWEKYAQGEYVGLARLAHVPEYRLRVDDELQIIYRITREETTRPYRLNVGDQIQIESATDPSLNREVLIQPDGTITLLLLGQVKATGLTVAQLRDSLEQLYRRYYRVPAITVTPILVNSKLEDLRATVDRRQGEGGQSQMVRVTPEGTIALPGLGSVKAQGLTLRELEMELNERYREKVEGIEAMPILVQRAPRYVYVLGEVGTPGRFELTGPTTVIQAISMAGGWKIGANLRQIVVFRRGDDWRLMATILDIQAALHGNKATPRDEIWLSDSDVVIVPKSFIQRSDDFIEMVFTRGIYGVFPLETTISFSKLSTI